MRERHVTKPDTITIQQQKIAYSKHIKTLIALIDHTKVLECQLKLRGASGF